MAKRHPSSTGMATYQTIAPNSPAVIFSNNTPFLHLYLISACAKSDALLNGIFVEKSPEVGSAISCQTSVPTKEPNNTERTTGMQTTTTTTTTLDITQ